MKFIYLLMLIALHIGSLANAKDANTNTSRANVWYGDCDVPLSENLSGIYYTLNNDRYPGTVAADIQISATRITLSSICLEPGWTVTQQSATNGIQLRFFYENIKAIDFKFVSGKTDIRNY